jgi:preprotein translocase subunit YajC
MISLDFLQLLAQTTNRTDAPAALEFLRNPMIWLIVMLVVFYFFMIRSRSKEERARKEMLNQIKKGDRVQTIGGILGVVVEARETEVVLKVDEATNTKLRFVRAAIHRVVGDEKQPAAAEKK